MVTIKIMTTAWWKKKLHSGDEVFIDTGVPEGITVIISSIKYFPNDVVRILTKMLR